MSGRPRLFDGYCCAGGAGRGYRDAGFYVVGADIAPQPNYAGDEFIQADVLELLADAEFVSAFDAIHVSPPCQALTTMSSRWRGHGGLADERPNLIPPTRELLLRYDVPWVMENVPGALRHMRSPIELTGEMFGLGVHRPRLFESNIMLLVPPRPGRQNDAAAIYGKQDGRRLYTRSDGTELRVSNWGPASRAMGIDWMTWDELREAIPPAYTEFIGEQLIRALEVAA